MESVREEGCFAESAKQSRKNSKERFVAGLSGAVRDLGEHSRGQEWGTWI